MGPYPYHQGLRLLLYGTVYGMGVACETCSIIQLYGCKYGSIKVAVLPRTILFLATMFSLIDVLYSICIAPMASPKPGPQHV